MSSPEERQARVAEARELITWSDRDSLDHLILALADDVEELEREHAIMRNKVCDLDEKCDAAIARAEKAEAVLHALLDEGGQGNWRPCVTCGVAGGSSELCSPCAMKVGSAAERQAIVAWIRGELPRRVIVEHRRHELHPRNLADAIERGEYALALLAGKSEDIR